MVFGGIAGVVSPEQGDPEEVASGPMPSVNTKNSEASDMQDLYRRTLAASWNSRSSDLPADKLVEDLFAGGTGWANDTDSARLSRLDDSPHVTDSPSGDADSRPSRLSPSFERRPKSASNNAKQNDGKGPGLLAAMGQHGRRGGSIEQQLYDNSKAKGSKSQAPTHELSEFDVREDLRSWEIRLRE